MAGSVPPPACRRPRRWLILAAYLPVIGLTQLLWLSFAPLIDLIEKRYGVGELTASTLILVFPLIYVVLSTHAGLLVDRRGYRLAIGGGAVLMAVSAGVRIFDQSFAVLLAGQVGIAIAQPYIVNGISKLTGDWFAGEEGGLALGLGTMGMYIGMAIGLAATPWLVERLGFTPSMVVFAVAAVLAAILFLAIVHPNEEAPLLPAPPVQPLRRLLRNRQLVLLFIIAALGLGEFNGLTTWLELILKPRGVSAPEAGIAGAMLIVGGIFGAAIVPGIAGWFGRRKLFILVCAALATVTLYPLCHASAGPVLIGLAALHGFFLLPSMALMLDYSAQAAGEAAAGAATGLLMLTGNAGGVVVAVAVPLMKGPGETFDAAVVVLVVLLGAAVLVATRLEEPKAAEAAQPV